MAEEENTTSSRAPVKRKTTYPRDHPTDNPKPPKRTKAEIQQAAKAKREAEQARKAAAEAEKKRKLLDAEEKRKLSAQRIAAVEDAVQRSQKKLQLHSDRPDLKTMETYKEEIQRQKDLQIDCGSELTTGTNQEDIEEEMCVDVDSDDNRLDFLPESAVDTDSDGIHLGFPPESAADTDSDGIRLDFLEREGDSDDMDEDYNDGEESSEEEKESVSDDSVKYRDLKRKKEKKKNEKELVWAEVQKHRQVAPTVYARPDEKLLDKEKGEAGKNTKLSGKTLATNSHQFGLHSNWKKRVTPSASTAATSATQPPENLKNTKSSGKTPATGLHQVQVGLHNNPKQARIIPPSITPHWQASVSRRENVHDQLEASNRPKPVSDGDEQDNPQRAVGGEIGMDEDDELLTAVRQTSEAAKKNHKGGTKGMGINLKIKTADISAVKHDASTRRPAKPRYKNSHLPFQNPTRDLLTWRDVVLPVIIDWAGTLDEPFAINSHPNLQDIVEDSWKEGFPEIPVDEAVQAVASSAIRNWRSAIGKHALLRLTKIFTTEPFKNSKNERKDYVEKELRDLSYIYRDPLTKSGAYRSSALMEVYAVHQQVISKTDTFYGYGAGALSLCAAAHERALKLWRTGNAPTKDTKKSFVRKPWAIRTAAHFKVVNKLSKRVWAEIHEASLLAMESVDLEATADNSEVEDHPEDIVQLSSEEEAA